MRDYFTVLRILIKDMLGHFRRRAILIQAYQLASSLFGMGAGLAIFTVLLSLETGQLRIAGYSFLFKPENTELIFVFCAIGALLLARSFFQFKSDISINKLCRLYEEYNVVRAFMKVDSLNLASFAKLHPGFDRRSAFRSVQADARFSATAQRMLLRTIVPTLMALIGTVMLMVVNPISIVLLGFFLVLSAIPLWLLSRRAFQISESFEMLAMRAARVKSNALDDMLFRAPVDEGNDGGHRELPTQPEIKSFMDVFEQRFNLISQSGMATGMLSAVVISIVTAVFTWQALKGQMPWSFVILHFVALQFIFQAIQRVSGLFVSMNRFYTQLKRYFGLVGYGAELDDGTVSGKVADSKNTKTFFPLVLRGNGDDKFKFTLNPGDNVFLVSGVKMDRLSIYQFLTVVGYHEIEDRGEVDEPAFNVFMQTSSPRKDLRDEAGVAEILEAGSPDDEEADKKKATKKLVVLPLSEKDVINRDFYIGECLQMAKQCPKVCFIDQVGLLKLTPVQVKVLLGKFSQSFVFIFAFRAVQPARSWGVEKMIAFNGQNISAIITSEEAAADRELLLNLTKVSLPTDIDVSSVDVAGVE